MLDKRLGKITIIRLVKQWQSSVPGQKHHQAGGDGKNDKCDGCPRVRVFRHHDVFPVKFPLLSLTFMQFGYHCGLPIDQHINLPIGPQ